MKSYAILLVTIAVGCGAGSDTTAAHLKELEEHPVGQEQTEQEPVFSYQEREARDSALYASQNGPAVEALRRGDILFANGDTLGALNVWRNLGLNHRNTFINREVLRRLDDIALLDYMADHILELE